MLPGSMIQQGFPTRGLVDLSYPIYWPDPEDSEILLGFSPLLDAIESLSLLKEISEQMSQENLIIESFSSLADIIEGHSPLLDAIETVSELE